MNIKKKLLYLLLAGFIVLLSACGDTDDSGKDKENNADNEAAKEEAAGGEQGQEMPEPDLENVPDVVAEVNGEEISKDEFESVYQNQFQSAVVQAQMSGQELDQDQLKKQLADGLIGQRLMIQEAEKRDMKATDEAVEQTLNSVIEQNGFESKDQLMEELKNQEVDQDEFMAEIKTQSKVDQLIAKESGDIEPTEEEVREAYDGLKKQQEALGEKDGEKAQEIPAFEEIKPQLTEKIKGQNEQQAYQKLVDQLRESSDVKNHLS